MIQIDYKSGVPIYDQIVSGISRLAVLGVLEKDTQLPSVRSFAVKLGVNPNTVQKAYIILEGKGIIYSIAGKGSFIASNDNAKKELMRSAGKALESAVLNAKNAGLTKTEIEKIVANLFSKEEE